MWEKFWRKFVKFIDPKLEKYREPKPTVEIPKYTPNSLEDFIGVIKRTPKSILTLKDRERLAAIMSFSSKTVADIMIKKKDMVFVGEKEFLGPLMLDKLYKSGFTIFPVIDSKNHIKGVIRTEALNALEIKKTDRAEKYLDPDVRKLSPSDSLDTLVSEIKTTGSTFFLVENSASELVGFVTINLLLDYLLS